MMNIIDERERYFGLLIIFVEVFVVASMKSNFQNNLHKLIWLKIESFYKKIL